MTRARARGLDVVWVALFMVAISSMHAAEIEPRVGLSRPAAGAGPYRNGLKLHNLLNDSAPCGPRQNHLFVNRPCFPRTGGGDTNNNQTGNSLTGNNQTGNTHAGDNGGGPVIVLGGSPYHLDDHGLPGDDPTNPGGNSQIQSATKVPDHFAPTPEPTYLAVTGAMFAAVWMLARKRRSA